MKSQEEMAAYFKNMPKKEKPNPYWRFDEGNCQIKPVGKGQEALSMKSATVTLVTVREYFRRVYESFHTEAQVLCVLPQDGGKLEQLGIPKMARVFGPDVPKIGNLEIELFVLPQRNSPANSIISEAFWQKYIVGNGIYPVARIHSHHVLDAYQSATDYSTLNSNTLEIVMGNIMDESLHVAFWLDEHGKDTKSNVFKADELGVSGDFSTQRTNTEYGMRAEQKKRACDPGVTTYAPIADKKRACDPGVTTYAPIADNNPRVTTVR